MTTTARTTVPHILLAGSPCAARTMLGHVLGALGRTTILDDSAAVPAVLDDERVDLVVLDLGEQPIDRLALCSTLRRAHPGIGIVCLVEGRDELSVITALDAGADDVVGKPIPVGEFLARVRACIRRGGRDGVEKAETTATGVRIDVVARQVWLCGEEIELTPTEFGILARLVECRGEVVTRAELQRAVWGDGTCWPGAKALDMHIAGLRRKLREPAGRPRLVRTVRGVGFRFDGPPLPAADQSVAAENGSLSLATRPSGSR